MSTPPNSDSQVSRPLLIVLGVVVGLAALYALYTFVLAPLLDDDGDVAEQVTPAPGPTPVDGATDGPTEEVLEGDEEIVLGDPVPETFEIFTARDPFQQLVVEASADDGTTTGTVVAPDPTATPTPTPTPTPTTAGTTGTGSGSSGSGSADADDDDPAAGSDADTIDSDTDGDIDEQGSGGAGEVYTPSPARTGSVRITIDAITPVPVGAEERLTVTIDPDETNGVSTDAESHEVVEGEVFAERFQLLDVDGRCATLLYGDARFTLCEGESIVR